MAFQVQNKNITDNFCYLSDVKCRSNILEMSMLINGVTRAVRVYANVNCYCITVKVICITSVDGIICIISV